MRRLLVLSLVLVGGLTPAVAQRGGGARGGFSGGGARGGFSSAGGGFRSGGAVRSFAPNSGVRAYGPPAGMARPGYGLRPGYAARPMYANNRGYVGARRGGYPVRRTVYGYGGYGGYPYVVSAWFPPDYLAYPDTDYEDAYVSDAPLDNYVEAASDDGQDGGGPLPPYPQMQPQQRAAQPARQQEDPITLVFKDGRPNEQIHNYMLTKDTLTVISGRRLHDVAVADLDLAATEKVNRDAGVSFKLPVGN